MTEQTPAVRIDGFSIGAGTDRGNDGEDVVVIAFDVPGLVGPDGAEAQMVPLAMALVDAEALSNKLREVVRRARRQAALRN